MINQGINKWDARFLKQAYEVSTYSKDPSTHVGAVIANGKHFISQGFNGFPTGVFDFEDRLNNRDIKYPMTVHAEINAIIEAKRDLSGYTIFTYPFMPCSTCAGAIINAGIERVVAPYDNNERWIQSFKLSTIMFNEAGVELVLVDADLTGHPLIFKGYK